MSNTGIESSIFCCIGLLWSLLPNFKMLVPSPPLHVVVMPKFESRSALLHNL